MKYYIIILLLFLGYSAQTQPQSFLFDDESKVWYEDNATPCNDGPLHNGGVIKYKNEFINLIAMLKFDWIRGSKDHYIIVSSEKLENGEIDIEIYIIKPQGDKKMSFNVVINNNLIYDSNMTRGYCERYLSDIIPGIKKKIAEEEAKT